MMSKIQAGENHCSTKSEEKEKEKENRDIGFVQQEILVNFELRNRIICYVCMNITTSIEAYI